MTLTLPGHDQRQPMAGSLAINLQVGVCNAADEATTLADGDVFSRKNGRQSGWLKILPPLQFSALPTDYKSVIADIRVRYAQLSGK